MSDDGSQGSPFAFRSLLIVEVSILPGPELNGDCLRSSVSNFNSSDKLVCCMIIWTWLRSIRACTVIRFTKEFSRLEVMAWCTEASLRVQWGPKRHLSCRHQFRIARFCHSPDQPWWLLGKVVLRRHKDDVAFDVLIMSKHNGGAVLFISCVNFHTRTIP